MRRPTLLAAAALAALTLCACGAKETTNTTTETTATTNINDNTAAPANEKAAAPAISPMSAQDFVTAAAIGDMYEIAAAKMALTRSKNPDVKMLARQMIADHSKSTAKLKMLISTNEVTAMPPMMVDGRRQAMLDALTMAAPGDFDATYVDQQDAAHHEMLMLMDGYKTGGANPALKGFATEVEPVVQMHIDMIAKLKTAMAATASGGNATGTP